MSILSGHHLNKSYHNTVLFNDWSFQHKSKSLVIGPNGSGKSTLIDMICGFTKYDGDILYNQTPITTAQLSLCSPFLFQATLFQLPVSENIIYFQKAYASSNENDSLLQKFSLSQIKDKKVSELSRGYQQFLQIYLCLMKHADIYLFDEPLQNLDTKNRECVLDIFHQSHLNILICCQEYEADLFSSDFERIYL